MYTRKCPKCGYSIYFWSGECPNCGEKIESLTYDGQDLRKQIELEKQ